MIVYRYHVVYQEDKEEFYVSTGWTKKTQWFEGPYSYDQGEVRVYQLNSLGLGRVFSLAREEMNLN